MTVAKVYSELIRPLVVVQLSVLGIVALLAPLLDRSGAGYGTGTALLTGASAGVGVVVCVVTVAGVVYSILRGVCAVWAHDRARGLIKASAGLAGEFVFFCAMLGLTLVVGLLVTLVSPLLCLTSREPARLFAVVGGFLDLCDEK